MHTITTMTATNPNVIIPKIVRSQAGTEPKSDPSTPSKSLNETVILKILKLVFVC